MDPLKPFSTMIRALWDTQRRLQKSAKVAQSAPTPDRSRAAPAEYVPRIRTLESRLRVRLASLEPWDRARARQLFIECVMISEFGEDLTRDPLFLDVVGQVSAQLATDAALSARLDTLLRSAVTAS